MFLSYKFDFAIAKSIRVSSKMHPVVEILSFSRWKVKLEIFNGIFQILVTRGTNMYLATAYGRLTILKIPQILIYKSIVIIKQNLAK